MFQSSNLKSVFSSPLHSHERRDEERQEISSLPYHERITQFIRGSTRHCVNDSVTVVDFRPLYAVTIYHLQRRLAQHIRDIATSEATEERLNDIQVLLRDYTSRLDNGPSSKLQCSLITELGLAVPMQHQTIYSDSDLLGNFDHRLLQHGPNSSRSRAANERTAEQVQARLQRSLMTWRRFIFAIVGGITIIAPVLIIATGNAGAKTLAVVSVAIFVFAIGMATFSAVEPEYLLGATAAYAAVLTVFVGNSTTSSCPMSQRPNM